MIKIEFNVGEIKPLEARALIALLEVVADEATPIKLTSETKITVPPIQLLGAAGGSAPNPVASLTPEQPKAVAQNVAAEVEKARRPGRPTKEEAAAKKAQEAAAKNPTPEASLTPSPSTQPSPSTKPADGSATAPPQATGEPRTYTMDELRIALQDFTVATSMKQGKELLTSYGCVRITELAEKDAATQTDFMQKCRV